MKGNNIITLVAIIGLVIAVLVLALRPSILNAVSDGTQSDKNVISATGIAQTKVKPDQVSIYLSIDILKDTAEQSKDENSIISNKVMASLKELGLKDGDIETLNYNIYPDYDWSKGQQKLKGYRATNSLKIKTKNFDILGKIIDDSVTAGANRVDSIQFELSPERESAAKKDALERASKDAREKAEATAKGLNVKLGKIVSVTTQDYYYQPYRLFEGGALMDAKSAVAEAPVINPQELETTANVMVSFELK